MAGSSLIELLVAVALLSIGALAGATLQHTSILTNQRAMSHQAALSLAQQLLESTRSVGFFDPSMDTTAPSGAWVDPPSRLSPASPLDAEGKADGNGRIFTRRWIVDTPIANVKRIRVRVAWNQNGRPHEIVLSTLKVR